MPITSVQGGPINNAGVMNAAIRQDAALAIGQVELEKVWRKGKKIANTPLVRVDCQGVDDNGQANLQAQINGQQGNSTIAHVLVDQSVGETSGPRADAQKVYAIRQVRGALQNSLSTGNTYTLTGTPT